jgi:chaperonin GroES
MAKVKLPIKPIGGNILVRPIEEDTTTTPSGLVISSAKSTERPQMGEIVALGTGRTDKEGQPLNWNVEVGQKIAFKKYSPDELEFENEKYLIMREEDILGIIQ